ncbi:thiolase family protein [Oceanobacillus neutriphilus]|uniref:Acyl-CoA dehydrogenase n=1 Tax=Oceanobacillus neutriphilus TaxID=531815 RepID=A0ABQ2NML5_9BACI|nr:thiolase family protein [Oceanobacillus neutriphilus]GGP07170.1 acyl-CoA dehydrogenase [Oceanobacillus neutriphilus]
MRDAVIVEAVRTPIGKRNGFFSEIRAEELAAAPLKELVRRTNLDAALINDVIMGCVTQTGEQAVDIARQAALIAGYPASVPGTTIDRQCGSSQQAIHFAAQAIISGDMDIVVAAGVESMSRVPMGSNHQGVKWNNVLRDHYDMIHQGIAAANIAEKWGISRHKMNEYSFKSHNRAVEAQEKGYFRQQMMSISIKRADGTTAQFYQDEGPRKNTSMEKLEALPDLFTENSGITAGNASQMSDGAAALLIMSDDKARELGFVPHFRILARNVIGSDPTEMLTGPIEATRQILKKADLSLEDIDVFEVNEAFASIPLMWMKELGADEEKVNIDGGAIALGHPLGASGARLMVTMLHTMERLDARFGLQTMCEGLGMANGTIIERLTRD